MVGEFIDAMPGKWLVWHAGGLLGPRRYACPKHRKELLRRIRYHYAYCGEQWVWKRPPYVQRWPPDYKATDADGSMVIPDWSDGANDVLLDDEWDSRRPGLTD
jgi:hypothetical protein